MTAPHTVELVAWDGPWPDDDRDANFKHDVALYSKLDPMETIAGLARNTGIPEGALVRYVLARWASAGSEALMVAGPSIVERMWAVFEQAEEANTDEERLRAYDTVRQMVSWLRVPLADE